MTDKQIAMLGLLGLGGFYIWTRYGQDELSQLRKQYNVPKGAQEVVDETGVHWTWDGKSIDASWEELGSAFRGIIGIFARFVSKESKAKTLLNKAAIGLPLNEDEAITVVSYAIEQELILDAPLARRELYFLLRDGLWTGFSDLGALELPTGIYEGYGPGWLTEQTAYR